MPRKERHKAANMQYGAFSFMASLLYGSRQKLKNCVKVFQLFFMGACLDLRPFTEHPGASVVSRLVSKSSSFSTPALPALHFAVRMQARNSEKLYFKAGEYPVVVL